MAEGLKPKLATLTIVVPPAVRATKGLAITRDGVPVGEAQWDVPVPVDVGEHVIVAAAPGYKPRDARQEILADGVGVQISIEPLEREPRAKVTQSAEFAGPERTWQRPMALSTMAVGAVGVGAGLILGAVAMARNDASNAENRCDAMDRCNEEGLAMRNEAIGLGNGATVAFIVGTAVLAGGVVLFVTAPKVPETSKSAPRVKASLGLGGFVVRGDF
jgi:hypothetical protein